jgi:hypothetical protein
MAAGLSVRAISAETGIPVGAVHRAKRQLEKTVAQGEEKAHPRQRPPLALAGVERSERIETRRSTYELVVGADDQPDARRTEQMHVDVFHGGGWWGFTRDPSASNLPADKQATYWGRAERTLETASAMNISCGFDVRR